MTSPTTAADALATAVATVAAAHAAATPDAVALAAVAAVTTNAASALEVIGSRTRAALVASWRKVNPYDDTAVQRFAAESARLLGVAQRQVGTVASASQSATLRAMGVSVPHVAAPDIPLDVRVAQRDSVAAGDVTPTVSVTYRGDHGDVAVDLDAQDSTTEAVLRRPARVYRFERSQGATVEQAAQRSRARLETVVDANLSLAQRMASRDALVRAAAIDGRITGWRRVFHPERSIGGVCGLCVAASDRTYSLDTLMPIHDRCKCTVVAVADHVTDFGRELNEADFQQLYGDGKAAGSENGTDGASLKKTRYRVDRHDELGPILVRVPARKALKFPVAPAESSPSVNLDALL